jgi:hypothetical protein
MPIKRVKKVKKEIVKASAKVKRKGQAQAQTNVQKVSVRIGETKPSKKEEQSSLVIAPTIAPTFHSKSGLSEAHFLPPSFSNITPLKPATLSSQGIQREQYINDHSGVVVGGNQNQRLLTPADKYAQSIQGFTNFSQVLPKPQLNYEAVEKEDHLNYEAVEPDKETDSSFPGAVPNSTTSTEEGAPMKKQETTTPSTPSTEKKNKDYYEKILKNYNDELRSKGIKPDFYATYQEIIPGQTKTKQVDRLLPEIKAYLKSKNLI